MRSWWKILGVLGGMAWSLTLGQTTAHAQFPPQPGGYGMPSGPVMGMPTSMGPPQGAFTGNPAMMGMPAEFPNPAVPSQEPVSPFSIKDEGMPNAFSELVDPRRPITAPYCLTFRGEYLGWYIPRGPVNTVLVTSSTSANDTVPGALGQPHTVIVVPASNNLIDYSRINGYRWAVGLGMGFVPPLEVSGFQFSRNLSVFQGGTSNAGLPFLARPVQFLDLPIGPGVGSENVEFVNVPTLANGSISIVSRMNFRNLDANLFFNFCTTDALKLDMLVGYRNAEFSESLDITSTLGGNIGAVEFNGVSFPAGFSTTAFDSFRTVNTFNGGQIGMRGVLSWERLSVFTDLKFAMGNTRSALTIDGSSTLTQGPPGRPGQSLPGGVLALPTNSGTVSENRFSIIPEANMSLSYQLHRNFRFFGGYNVFYWSQVIRPGDHLNSVVDSRQIPTDHNYNPRAIGVAPGFPSLVNRDFFAHGFNFGIEIGF